jgi:uncharacterized protein YaiE (UPF0345 family)
MSSFKNVELVKKANVYFDGNVTSRTFVDENGEEKSLGIMMPGEYNFGTAAAELMEIIDGDVEVKLAGSDTWNTYTAGTSFEVVANSNFDIKVKTLTDYCCSYIK